MRDNKTHILLVEDDETLGYLLSEYLQLKNFEVAWCKNVVESREKLNRHNFQLAILDVMLPDVDGFTFAEQIASLHPDLPFIFLTARSLKTDVLKGFAIGAVDYLKKPVDEEELVARIHAILRRNSVSKAEINNNREIGGYLFDPQKQELVFKDNIQSLTARENDILMMLTSNINQLTTYQDILVIIWGENDYFNRKSLNVYISNLRKYLKKDTNVRIENIHRKGFVLKVDNS